MSQSQVAVFFNLLRSGLWHRSADLSLLPKSNQSWELMFRWAQKHTVEGIIFDAFNFLPLDKMPPKKTLYSWTSRVDRIERLNSSMNEHIALQYGKFNKVGLSPILLKGQSVSRYYKSPNHRVCGDVDWFVSGKSNYKFLIKELQKDGCDINKTPGFSASFFMDQFEIELHAKAFDLHSPLANYRLRRWVKREYLTNEADFHGERVLVLAPIFNLLQVNLHILKHLLAFGVGIRQFCDAAVLYDRLYDEINSEKLSEIYKALGVYKWMELLHVSLVRYIGLDKSKLPFPAKDQINSSWMMKDVWTGGNFGLYDSNHINEDSLQRIKSRDKVWGNIKKYLPYAPMEAICFPLSQLYSRIELL